MLRDFDISHTCNFHIVNRTLGLKCTCIADCGTSATGLSPFLASDNINCHLSSNCTTLTCCMEDTLTKSHIQVQASIDPCTFSLKLKIEKMTRDITLLNYTWGMLVSLYKEIRKSFWIIAYIFTFYLQENSKEWICMVYM